MNLIQFVDNKSKRAVGLVSGGKIIRLKNVDRMTALATRALKDGKSLNTTAKTPHFQLHPVYTDSLCVIP